MAFSRTHLQQPLQDHLHGLLVPVVLLVGLEDVGQVPPFDVLLKRGLDVVPEAAVLAREPLAPGDKSNNSAIVFCSSSRKNFLEDFLLKWCQSQPLNQPLGH